MTEQKLAMILAAIEQAARALNAGGHRVTPLCSFIACTCRAVEKFRVERGEFFRQYQAIKSKPDRE